MMLKRLLVFNFKRQVSTLKDLSGCAARAMPRSSYITACNPAHDTQAAGSCSVQEVVSFLEHLGSNRGRSRSS